MKSRWEVYIGIAISEITEKPNPIAQVEKSIPEIPYPRIAKTEWVDAGTEKVLNSETDVQIKELYDETKLQPNQFHYNACLNNYPLEVVIPELTPMYSSDGKIINEKTREPLMRKYEYHYKYPYAKEGEEFKGYIDEYPSVRCYYLGRRNATVPHITMGEQVLVYYHRGNQIFYWKELGRDNYLPRLEKYRLFVNDQQSVKKSADVNLKNENRPNDDNTYYLEFDTINKHIILSTSASDGERTRYWLKMNPKDMTFSIWDTDGNRIQIDSKQHRIYLRNREQSTVDIHNQDINIWSQNSVTIESDTINLTGRINYNETVGVDPRYKATQVSDKLHQQSYAGKGPMLGNYAPLTGAGNKTKFVATQEEFTTPLKKDQITDWQITNMNYTFTGQIMKVVANILSETITQVERKTDTVAITASKIQILYALSYLVLGSTDKSAAVIHPKLTVVDFICTGKHPWVT